MSDYNWLKQNFEVGEPMLSLPGYTIIEKISNNEEISFFRMLHLESQEVLLAKTVNEYYSNEDAVKSFQDEIRRFHSLEGTQVMTPVRLEIIEERPILLFQNIEGFTLQKLLLTINKNLSLLDKLTLAIALVDCVHRLDHANYVINELIPLYFFVSRDLTKIKLADVRFVQEKNEKNHYLIANRNIASLYMYVSPEKVKFMNEKDSMYETSYSIGMILYELFAEAPPYPVDAMSTIMGSKMTTVQQSIYLKNSTIPPIISAIVNKCLDKVSSARYRTMDRLKADLEECHHKLQVHGEVHSFSLTNKQLEIVDEKEGTRKDKVVYSGIERVDNPTSQLLSQAAFLGSSFKLSLLSQMTNYSIEQLQESLQMAINNQLIYQISSEKQFYAFQNEEIRQFFQQRVSEKDRPLFHFEAGTALANHVGEEFTFPDVLEHLNEVKELVIFNGQRVKLIQLNFEAAKEEKRQDKAIAYLQMAMNLLEEEHWQNYYEMSYRILNLRIELAIANEPYEIVKEFCRTLVARAETDIDRVEAYNLWMKLELNYDYYDEVISLGQSALDILQQPIKLKMGKLEEWFAWRRLSKKLGKTIPNNILNLPPMEDKRSKALARVLVYIANACFSFRKEGWSAAVLALLDLTFKRGITSESAYGFASYALIECRVGFNYRAAYHYSKFASEIVKGHSEIMMQVYTMITLCQDSWRKYEPDFLLSITDYTNHHGVLSNNKGQTNFNFLTNCALLFDFSYPLKDLYIHLLSRSSLFQKDYNTSLWKYATVMSSLLTKLTGYRAGHDPFAYEKFEMSDNDAYLEEVFSWHQYITAYILGNYEEAYEAVVYSLEIDLVREAKSLGNVSNDYYYVLIAKELFDSKDSHLQEKYLKQIRQSVKNLKRMAKRCPENYLHKYLATEAEQSKILKRSASKVEASYEQAIAAAHLYGHLHDVGIISECYAKYWLQKDQALKAKVYLNEAYEAYQKWGALAKLAQLEKEYHELLLKQRSDLEQVDYLTIVSSAQALSDEMEIEQLVFKLLQIMMQNAGAEYGALVFDNDGQWYVEAFGTMEHLNVESIPLDEASEFVPKGVIDYTIRMQEAVVLHNASNSGFSRNSYIQKHQLKSVLCLPITYQNKVLSVLYMENNAFNGVFTEERLGVLKLLCSQCAISITNARLYSDIQYLSKDLEMQVEARTASLKKSMEMTSEALTEMNIYAERNRIAQEIHDIVGHTLTSTILQIEAGRRLLTKDMNRAEERFKDAQNLVRHSLNEIRHSVHMLKEDKYYDVRQALMTLIEETERNTGVQIRAKIASVNHLPIIMKKLLYHALQEGLTNGIRHGDSTKFYFTLKDDGERVEFVLKDNGVGGENIKMGFGLSMMKDRVQQLKGTLTMNAGRERGCILQIILPYTG